MLARTVKTLSCKLTACPKLIVLYPLSIPYVSKAITIGSIVEAAIDIGTKTIPTLAFGYCMQNTAKNDSSAPLAPPDLMIDAGTGPGLENMVVRC